MHGHAEVPYQGANSTGTEGIPGVVTGCQLLDVLSYLSPGLYTPQRHCSMGTMYFPHLMLIQSEHMSLTFSLKHS